MSTIYTGSAWQESPYKGTARVIHLALADWATETGLAWPKQETLAEKANCSIRYVRTVLARMIKDGFIELATRAQLFAEVGRRHLTPHQYIYRLLRHEDRQESVDTGTEFPFKEEQCSGLKRNSSAGSYIEPSVEPSVEPKTSEPAARKDQEADMAIGQLDGEEPVSIDSMEDDARQARKQKREDRERKVHRSYLRRNKKADLPKKGTHWWCFRTFENEATKQGHPEFNSGLLGRCLQRLHDVHNLTYDEIDELIRIFFAGEKGALRGPVDAAVLFRSRIDLLVKKTESSRANMRKTGVSSVAVNKQMMGNVWKQLQDDE